MRHNIMSEDLAKMAHQKFTPSCGELKSCSVLTLNSWNTGT